MDIVLKIAGGIFIFLVLIAAIVGLYFWLKWKKFKDYLSIPQHSNPSRIHLIPDTSPDWCEEDDIKKRIFAFRSLGFTDVRAFRIKEMEPLRLYGFVHIKEQMAAVVYKHDIAGVWSDVCIEYENGNSLTVSNAPMGQEIDVRPSARKLFYKELNETELFEKTKSEREEGPYKSFSIEDFSKRFEESYAEDMDWRNSRGGITKEEIRRVAENMKNVDFSDDDIDEAYMETIWNMLEQLNEDCIQQFITTTTMSVAEWEKVRDSLFTIHDKIPSKLLIEYLEEYIELPEYEEHEEASLMDEDISVNQLFIQINEQLPDELKSKKVGEVSEPVQAEIYAAPLHDDW